MWGEGHGEENVCRARTPHKSLRAGADLSLKTCTVLPFYCSVTISLAQRRGQKIPDILREKGLLTTKRSVEREAETLCKLEIPELFVSVTARLHPTPEIPEPPDHIHT